MFWDRVAGVYDIFVNVINRRVHRELRSLIAGIMKPGEKVFECACGTGMLTEVMAGICAEVTATDISENMLRRAEHNCRRFSNISYRKADIMSLDEPDGSYDTVVAANVIHLLDEPGKALAELDRICRPGGRLIIPTYVSKTEAGADRALNTAIDRAGADFKREFDMDSYREFFRRAGYEDAEYTLIEGKIPCAVAVIRKKVTE